MSQSSFTNNYSLQLTQSLSSHVQQVIKIRVERTRQLSFYEFVSGLKSSWGFYILLSNLKDNSPCGLIALDAQILMMLFPNLKSLEEITPAIFEEIKNKTLPFLHTLQMMEKELVALRWEVSVSFIAALAADVPVQTHEFNMHSQDRSGKFWLVLQEDPK